MVSPPDVIALAADKLMTARFLKGVGLGAPMTYASLEEALMGLDSGEVGFPLVLKLRWGTASLGIEVVDNQEEFRLAWDYGRLRLPRLGLCSGAGGAEGMLIQGLLSGEEYGLDVINDLQGRYRTTFVKRKLAMRGGETESCCVLELNPRFGGGYPFSAEAGADVPAALIAWAEGREPSSCWDVLRDGVASAKCDRLVRIGKLHLASHVEQTTR